MIRNNDNLIFYSDSFKDSHFSGNAAPIQGLFSPRAIYNLLCQKTWVPPCAKSFKPLELIFIPIVCLLPWAQGFSLL